MNLWFGVNESSSCRGDSSSAELEFRDNPKTEIDYNTWNDGELNPNYRDYHVLNGGLLEMIINIGRSLNIYIITDDPEGHHSYIRGVLYGKYKNRSGLNWI